MHIVGDLDHRVLFRPGELSWPTLALDVEAKSQDWRDAGPLRGIAGLMSNHCSPVSNLQFPTGPSPTLLQHDVPVAACRQFQPTTAHHAHVDHGSDPEGHVGLVGGGANALKVPTFDQLADSRDRRRLPQGHPEEGGGLPVVAIEADPIQDQLNLLDHRPGESASLFPGLGAGKLLIELCSQVLA